MFFNLLLKIISLFITSLSWDYQVLKIFFAIPILVAHNFYRPLAQRESLRLLTFCLWPMLLIILPLHVIMEYGIIRKKFKKIGLPKSNYTY